MLEQLRKERLRTRGTIQSSVYVETPVHDWPFNSRGHFLDETEENVPRNATVTQQAA